MKIKFLQGDDIISKSKEQMEQWISSGVEGVMILSCDKNAIEKEEYDAIIPKDFPVFGGVFPQIIYENKNYDQGILLVGLPHKPEIKIIENISDLNVSFDEVLDEDILDHDYKTMFVFVDAFSNRIGGLISGLFNSYGLEINFIGGGAGSLEMIQKPCVFTNQGVLEDAAVLASISNTSSIGVKHGWEDLSGPYKVSHSEGNTIHMLDNRPAFDIYKNIVEKDVGKTIDAENFFEVAKAYPFGISKIGAEKVVRDPIVLGENGELVCVGEVPKNAFVHILKGKPENLIKASHQALDIANTSCNSDRSVTFFIDCISRVLFLGDDFQEELNVVNENDALLFGALTLGEIANNGSEYLEFFNKTAVVALINEL